MINLTSDNLYVYDFEVYPNLICVTFTQVKVSDGKLQAFPKKVFEISAWQDDRKELRSFIQSTKNLVLIGFNSLGYDDSILTYLLELTHSPISICLNLLYQLSKEIVGTHRGDVLPERVKKYRYAKKSWDSLDMMHIRPSSRDFVSLKQMSINLKWHRVQDLPYPFDTCLTRTQALEVIEYNENDVLITIELLKELIPQVQLRIDISKLYEVDVLNKDESAIANVLLNKFYQEYSGIPYEEFKTQRTNRETIDLADCIPKNVSFKSPVLVDLLNRLRKTVLKKTWDNTKKRWGFKLSEDIVLNGVIYDMRSGGLHSRDILKPGVFNSDSEWQLRDADVTSFYPFLGKEYRIKPAHLEECYFKILDMVISERVTAKQIGDMVKALALKIVANAGFFGKFGSEYFWMKDDLALMKVTIAGQLVIFTLIDELLDKGFEVISANTDGVVTKIKKSRLAEYDSICQAWQKRMGFSLEFVDYETYVRRDVNNYFTSYLKKGKLEYKEKGVFEQKQNLFKGYKTPIIAKALHEFFVNGVEPIDTIRSSQSIYDFCISKKVAAEFKTKFLAIDSEGQMSEEVLQKSNRFYVTKSGGALYKTKASSASKFSFISGEVVRVCNNVDAERAIESYDIKYEFYEKEVWKVIDSISPRVVQGNLFDMVA